MISQPLIFLEGRVSLPRRGDQRGAWPGTDAQAGGRAWRRPARKPAGSWTGEVNGLGQFEVAAERIGELDLPGRAALRFEDPWRTDDDRDAL